MARLARRPLIASIILAASTGPGAAQAARRIAFVHSGVPVGQLTEGGRGPLWIASFFVALRRAGYMEGRNLVVERYSADGIPERFAALARQIVDSKPEAIVANHTDLVGAITRATSTIPVVAIVADPVGSGLVKSLARPGGNLTGVTTTTGLELLAKGLQKLKEAVPAARKIGFLASVSDVNEGAVRALGTAGQKLDVDVTGLYVSDTNEERLRSAIEGARQQQIDAIMVGTDGSLLGQRALIVELAARHRMPMLYPYRDYFELGGLLAYFPDVEELGQRMGENIGRILGGTPAGDIPFWQPTRIRLAINQKTARALGITLPLSLLSGADEVID